MLQELFQPKRSGIKSGGVIRGCNQEVKSGGEIRGRGQWGKSGGKILSVITIISSTARREGVLSSTNRTNRTETNRTNKA